MILGRIPELKYLNSYYDRSGSQIMVLYGQKYVGKTRLLRQFVQEKNWHYYRARSAAKREQQYLWGKELKRDGFPIQKYPSYTEIFNALLWEKREKSVIVIDEFQYMVKTDDAFMKELIHFVREKEGTAPVMVILCSSSIGWVENGLLHKIGILAHELSGILKIRELDFEAMREFYPGFSMEQSVEAYAVLGGACGLWKHFDDHLSIKENICRSILQKGAFLYEEGRRLVEDELRETGIYNTIIAAIAEGNYKLNDLHLHTGFSRAKISVYLKNLMELELIEKVFSFDTEGRANAQKGVYRISNHFVHFYFTFLYPNLSSLEIMEAEAFYEQYIAPAFSSYVSDYFKCVCRQKLAQWNRQRKLPLETERTGEWVGKAGNIDIIMQSEAGGIIAAACSWKQSMGYEDYEKFLFCGEKARLKPAYIYLFSAKGFEERLRAEAEKKQNLKLIGMDEVSWEKIYI